ncbi:MAG TPA: hypothetical protein VNH46_07530, partial [Gemmatimonadales bacterium]|nr:hypothetical protein [Gemmatimonadales bacterium]
FTLLFSGTPSPAGRARAEALQDAITADLMRLDTARVRVVLLVTASRQDYFWLGLLLPDPSHPDVCVLTVSDPVLARTAVERREFGPCVFYAAFGNPGPGVETWLVNRQLDVARDYAWWEPDRPVAPGTVDLSWWRPGFLDFLEGGRIPWYGRTTPALIACQAGWVDGCRRALFSPLRGPDSPNGSERIIRLAWPGQPRAAGLGAMLAALVRRFGPERFGRFWRAQQPVEDAFSAAFGMAPGRWGEDWVVRQLGRTYTGPVVHWSSALAWLALAAAAVAASAVFALRRQIG